MCPRLIGLVRFVSGRAGGCCWSLGLGVDLSDVDEQVSESKMAGRGSGNCVVGFCLLR